ncbi:TPA: hypothetical protein ACHTCR_004840 [Pseudomonas putida]|uniref:hypothetical protein n=1 Tax=Pseudomonas TaxID=286 RepID=UPI00114D09DE|nr:MULTISPECIES: hypothetical protein [Pseudomonas]MCE1001459.1 hypothetical protein [Pseudomonas sp. NMI1173_11]
MSDMFSFYADAKNFIFWLKSVGLKLTRIVPLQTLIVVTATLVSQASLLISYFLPLKVIIIIGSGRTPNYFPSYLQSIDHKNLVIALSIATVLFYGLYALAENVIVKFSERGALQLIQKSQKIVLFNNQDELAAQAYQRYSRSLAAGIFISAASTGLLIINPYLFATLAIYGIIFTTIISIIYKKIEIFNSISNTSKLSNLAASLGFLLTFFYIVGEYLTLGNSSALIAIVSILIVRQTLQRLSNLIVDLNYLHLNRIQVNALFFHGHALTSPDQVKDQDFWKALELSERNTWIQSALNEVTDDSINVLSSKWFQVATTDTAAFEVTVRSEKNSDDRVYLVKLFNKSRRDLALQEATILAACRDLKLPTLEFSGTTMVQGFHCVIFLMDGETQITFREVKAKKLELFGSLLAIEPPASLASRFLRSKPLLWGRLNDAMIDRIAVAASDDSTRENIKAFKSELPAIKATLQKLPLQFVNTDITPDTVRIDRSGHAKLSQWGRWTLEPIGACWPVTESELKCISPWIKKSRAVRKSLANVDNKEILLAAFVHSFERCVARQQFLAANELVPEILRINCEIQALTPSLA